MKLILTWTCSLDADQKEELVTVLDKLLSDRTTLVVGSAVMAFEEVNKTSLISCYWKAITFLLSI